LKSILHDAQFRNILRYSLVNDSITSFEFNSEINGILQVGDNLDYETTTEYTFDIAVHDTGGQNDTATVSIKVLDVNDNKKDFQVNLNLLGWFCVCSIKKFYKISS